jgi:hypothetical protein
MFDRHLKYPHIFHCVTDAPEGLRADIVAHPLPAFDFCDHDIGNGRKLVVFSDDFLGLNGQLLLQVDIDLVLVDDVGFVLDNPDLDFVIARGRNQSGNTRGHGAIYRTRVGSRADIWRDLMRDPVAAVAQCQHHRGLPGQIAEQRYIDWKFQELSYFEDGRIVYFRQDCNAFADHLNPSGIAYPPPGARVVSFAGKIKPQHVMHGSFENCRHAPFVKDHWFD